MKAAVFKGPELGLSVEEVPTPEPGPGEVLIRVAGCGVCHTDLHYVDQLQQVRKDPPRPGLPQVLCQEVVKRGHRVGRDESVHRAGLDYAEEGRGLLCEGLSVRQYVENHIDVEENPCHLCFPSRC